MLVVSDTSPLNYLILIGHEGLLPELFNRVTTAPAVMSELGHPGSPDAVRSWAARPPAWLEILAPKSINPRLALGAGECEAISLAAELRADAVLIDERRASTAAVSLGLRVTGTLGVLLLAHDKGRINLLDTITKLRATTFRGSDTLFDAMLRRSTHRPPGPGE